MLLFYSIILAKLLTCDYASIYRRTTYDITSKDSKAINNLYVIIIIRSIL